MYVALICICILIIIFLRREKFATRREKASAIYEWFKNNKTPTYDRYRGNISGSNIVEYEDARAVFYKGGNIADMEKII